MLSALRTFLSNRAKKRRDEHLAEVFDRCFVRPFDPTKAEARARHAAGVKAAFEMQRDFLHAHLGPSRTQADRPSSPEGATR